MRLLVISTNSPYGELEYVRTASGGAEQGLRTYAEHAAREHQVTYLSTAHTGLHPLPRLLRAQVRGVSVVHLRGPSIPGFQSTGVAGRRAAWLSSVRHVSEATSADVILSYATIPDTLAAVRSKHDGHPKVVEWVAGRSWELDLWRVPGDLGLLSEAFGGKDMTLFETDALQDYTRQALALAGLPDLGRTARIEIPAGRLPVADHGSIEWPGAKGPVVACLATFKPGSKRHDILLDAWPTVLDKVGDATLVLAGDGELKNAMQQRARDLGIERTVQFAGTLNRDRVGLLLSSAALVVLPTEFEGRPQALVESMYSGVPVAASDIPAVRETLEPLGELAEACLFANEAQSVSDTISSILCDKELRAMILDRLVRLPIKGREEALSTVDEALSSLLSEPRS